MITEWQTFDRAMDQLARMVERHAGGRPLRGLSDYWLANDITARSNELRIDVVSDKMDFRFYNNNAAHLCEAGYYFVLHDVKRNIPDRSLIVSKMGEPAISESIGIVRYGIIEILYYDTDLIDRRVIEDGKEAATRLFPSFSCAP